MPTLCDKPLTGLDWLEYYSNHNVYHPGIDCNHLFGNSDLGNPVRAAKSGFVEFVWNSAWNSGGFGKFVIIQHPDGNYTRYAHLEDIEDKIRSGKEVKEGDLIGHVGNTGTVYAHLHFEVFNKKCAEWQSKHWRRWRAYPTRWSKAKVQEYYLNPWTWLKDVKDDKVPEWASEAYTWAKDNKLINNFEGNNMSDYEVALVLYRYYKKYN